MEVMHSRLSVRTFVNFVEFISIASRADGHGECVTFWANVHR